MRNFKTLAYGIAAFLAFNGAAQAGEPFHPIYQPVVDFFRFFGGWF
jgi:hypothetical protein